jgi:hypothetical protein
MRKFAGGWRPWLAGTTMALAAWAAEDPLHAQIEVIPESELSVGARFAVAIENDDLDAVKALVEAGNSPGTAIDYGPNQWSVLMKAS